MILIVNSGHQDQARSNTKAMAMSLPFTWVSTKQDKLTPVIVLMVGKSTGTFQAAPAEKRFSAIDLTEILN